MLKDNWSNEIFGDRLAMTCAAPSISDTNLKRTERMLNAWDFLVDATKHRSRFFFHDLAAHKKINGVVLD